MKKENLFHFLKRNRDFNVLLSGQIISQLGDAINWMANLGLVAIIAPGIGASFLMIWLMIPIVTLGPFAGVLVDRFSRKRIMMISDFSRAATVLLFIFTLINYTSVKNEEFTFKYKENKITDVKNSMSELISKKEGNIKNRNIEAAVSDFENNSIKIYVKGDFGNSDTINGTLYSSSEDYEKIKLIKAGNSYSAVVKKRYSDSSKKKNRELELKKEGEFTLNITEKLGPTFLVYLITFFISIVTQFYIPAKSALIPEVVEKEELVYANSLSASAARIVMIIGGAVGGFLIGKFGLITAFWADLISYIISFSTLCFVKEKRHISIFEINESITKEKKSAGFFGEFVEGIKYLMEKATVRFAVLSYIAVMSAGGIGYIFLIKYSNETLGMGVEGLGYLQTSLGAGLVAGALLVGVIGNKIEKTHMIKAGIVIISVSALCFAFIDRIYFALATGVFAGVGAAFIIVMSETILQIVVKTEFRGRIFGILQTVTNASFALFAIGTGLILSGVEEKTIFISIAVFMVLFLFINQVSDRLRGNNGKNRKNS